MSSQAELPGAVEAKRAEREKPDCGGAAEPEFGLGRALLQERSPGRSRDVWWKPCRQGVRVRGGVRQVKAPAGRSLWE